MSNCAGTRRRSHDGIAYKGSSCPLCQEMLRADEMMEQRDEAMREINRLQAHTEELAWSRSLRAEERIFSS